eukprot:1577122-Pyramimonas_sp.AAC.1
MEARKESCSSHRPDQFTNGGGQFPNGGGQFPNGGEQPLARWCLRLLWVLQAMLGVISTVDVQ